MQITLIHTVDHGEPSHCVDTCSFWISTSLSCQIVRGLVISLSAIHSVTWAAVFLKQLKADACWDVGAAGRICRFVPRLCKMLNSGSADGFSSPWKDWGQCQCHWVLYANWHTMQVSKLSFYIKMTSSPSTTQHTLCCHSKDPPETEKRRQ